MRKSGTKIKTHQKQKGVTLLELLIVCAVTSIIALAIASTFSTGIAVYGKVRNYGGSRIDLLLALERMEKDIRNSFFFAEMPWGGTSDSIYFPGIETIVDAEEKEVSSLGQYRYFLDNGVEKKLKVEWIPYAQATSGNRISREEEFLANIESFEIRYYYFEEGKDSKWVDAWDDPLLMPRGIEIKLLAKYGEEEIMFERKIFIPASQMLEEEKEDDEDFFDEEEGFSDDSP